jgi:hypothetical protein
MFFHGLAISKTRLYVAVERDARCTCVLFVLNTVNLFFSQVLCTYFSVSLLAPYVGLKAGLCRITPLDSLGTELLPAAAEARNLPRAYNINLTD